jgi:2-keto-4-pentenoate hydratase/2-oxohepta-3-ene-1,7-dioic acid hydratase in catechol pathway
MAKIARFEHRNAMHYGLLKDDDTLDVIDGDVFGEWQASGEEIALSDVKLLAPVDPPNIIAIGLNYTQHAHESGMEIPERPVIFLKATTALCGPEDDIVLPAVAPNEVDYECELAIIIGRKAKHVSEDEAFDYVLGYTCSNDVSARDCQIRLDAQWARGKSFDTFAPLGPWIETELDPDSANIRTRLNGKVMQDSNTNDLIFSCRELVSYISHSMTLLPGTVIMTGTPSGVGFARQPAVFLQPGDTVAIEVEGIGVLENTVAAEEV